jgi:hypothetical protein
MSTSDETQLTLDRFKRLPKRYQGKTVEFLISNDDEFTAVDADTCESLNLPIGDTVSDGLEIENCGFWYLYASGETANNLLNEPKFTRLRVWAQTRFGVKTDTQWTDDGPHAEKSIILGLVIEKFEPVASDA